MRANDARKIPIHLCLQRAGIVPAKVTQNGRQVWYSSPLREGDTSPSFKVDTVLNLRYDHGLWRGGNVIDLVIELRRVSVREALAILEAGSPATPSAARPLSPVFNTPASAPMEVLSVEAVSHQALIQYLEGRAINVATARRYLKQVRYRRQWDKRVYFALGFPSWTGFDARSPVFKGFIGTGKDVSIHGPTDTSTIAVFEGPYDFLTWLTLHEMGEPDCAVIVLHSVALKRRALELIQARPFSEVLFFLDHDPAGQEATTFFQAGLSQMHVVDCSANYAGYKDLNEWRIASHGLIAGK
jgi:hypothetical protein